MTPQRTAEMGMLLIGLLLSVQAPDPCGLGSVLAEGQKCRWRLPSGALVVEIVQEPREIIVSYDLPPFDDNIRGRSVRCLNRMLPPGESRSANHYGNPKVVCSHGEALTVSEQGGSLLSLRRTREGWRIETAFAP